MEERHGERAGAWTTEKRKGKNMPAGDRTGPMGMGPLTGRAAGFCAGNGRPGYANPVPGYGCGMGFGRGRGGWGRGGGRGWRHGFHATGLAGWQRAQAGWPGWGGMPPGAGMPSREERLDALRTQTECLETALGDLRKQREQIEADTNAACPAPRSAAPRAARR